ncbi:class II glutamine amidotransferase [Roseiconus nitratireducens]|uniref:Class II glutamine amidotransferase n=1 Tax=Roseiconus nitratireducens TaxID=2605748 RepID=A0A5M6DI93_9BACT|nr:class II glutamine amidotransferase [Roseiconus nitratireducens]KAA5547274.1 class II glutamine amidotransferase [Roseiconus nitratireducens]
MCRWLAYLGDPIRLDKLLYTAEDAFVGQSLHSRQSTHPVNGDGSGLGWYSCGPQPGLFRTTRPAWNSGNLRDLSDQLESHLFFAHVRATSGTAIQESNCHPFRYRDRLFQHNGVIQGYDKLKKPMDMAVRDDLYPLMEGSTDTERLFYLALTFGLLEDVGGGLSRMVRFVEETASNLGIDNPITMTAAVGAPNGIHAVRYSSDGESPTLYHSHDLHSLRVADGDVETLPDACVLLLSEPLDDVPSHWQEVPESSLLTVTTDHVDSTPFPLE